MAVSRRIIRARTLRRDQTDAERELWAMVRNRQLDGCKFRRQSPIDCYVADFVCVEAKLIVELDGAQHADHVDYDAERTQVLQMLGWRLIRFWNHQVMLEPEAVLETILAAIKDARP